MDTKTTCTAIRTDRALAAVHGGTLLASRMRTLTSTTTNGVAPKAAFGSVVPAYVADQEPFPPRGDSPV